MQKRSLYVGLSFLGVIIGILVWLFVRIPAIEQTLRENMTQSVIDDLGDLIGNIEADIMSHTQNRVLYQAMEGDEAVRQHLEHNLQFLVTPSIKYVYVLYWDGDGFRFVLDGSQGEDRAEFGQPFFVEDQAWLEAYRSGEQKITYQQGVPDLWISYIHPIRRNGVTEGMITLEFSKDKYFDLLKLIRPIQNAFVLVFVFIALVIGIAVFQLFQYFWIKKKSLTDPLTGLYNRQYLNDLKRTINVHDYQLMMMDIDYFKQLNDTYGHQVGDLVLQKVSASIRGHIRNDDILIRYGGEEFLLLLHNPTREQESVNLVAERIRRDVQECLEGHHDIPLRPTISIGVEAHTERTKHLEEAIRHADEMLYLAKKRGRNRVEVYHELKSLPERAANALMTITDVKEAIDENRLVCHFQPIVDMHGEIARYEALVRLIDREGAVIAPRHFLPLISNTNIYADMTKAVIDYCFKFFSGNACRFSINLNFSDLLNEAVVSILQERLDRHPEMARRLTIELLEDEKIEDLSVLQQQIRHFRQMGVRFAIDDFGSGYANFGNLFKLEFDCLKIDGELIRNLDTSEYCRSMVESLSSFAKKANLKVIAEYVENEAVLARAKAFNIDFFQGYHIGKPEAGTRGGGCAGAS